jgi:hypothetical protein
MADFTNFAFMHRGDDHDQIVQAKRDGLVGFAAQLKERDGELEQHYQALIARANEWLRDQ